MKLAFENNSVPDAGAGANACEETPFKKPISLQRRRNLARQTLMLEAYNTNDYIHILYQKRMISCLSPNRLRRQHSTTAELDKRIESLHREYAAKQAKEHKLSMKEMRRCIDEIEQQRARQEEEEEKCLKKEQEERRKRIEEAIAITNERGKLSAEEEQKALAEAKAKQDDKKKMYMSLKGAEEYEEQYKHTVKVYESTIEPKIKAKQLEAHRMLFTKLNAPLNNSDVVGSVLPLISQRLDAVMASFPADQHADIAEPWICHHIASRLLTRIVKSGPVMYRNADKTRGDGVETAVFLIHFTPHHPSFVDFVIALLKEACPFLIPRIPPAPSSEKVRAFLTGEVSEKTVGDLKEKDPDVYHYVAMWMAESQDPKYEKYADDYVFKQRTFVNFFACICVQPSPQWPHPYPIRHAWIWLARFLNLRPCYMSMLLLDGFLDVACDELSRTYGRQMQKIMVLLHEAYIPLIESMPKKQRGPVGFLSNVKSGVERYLKTGRYIFE